MNVTIDSVFIKDHFFTNHEKSQEIAGVPSLSVWKASILVYPSKQTRIKPPFSFRS
jgi:hypothetical protein